MAIEPTRFVVYKNIQNPIAQQLREAGMAMQEQTKKLPSFILVILPEGGNDVYTAVKQ
jgi:eukaryotic translation initiation factor 2C